MKSNFKKTVIAFFILIGVLVNWVTFAEALEPRLFWEKKLPFKIDDIRLAATSGDIILYSQEARQIILYDKSGNKRSHWGPRIDRQPMGINISDDGNIIVYTTSWAENYIEKKKIDISKLGWDKRVHYSTKKGKELWNKPVLGMSILSPDGKMVAIGKSAGEGGDLTILDSQGKVLWKYISREVDNIVFSPDSNYILFSGEEGLHLLDRFGNLLWKKNGASEVTSVSEGGMYITTSGSLSIPRRTNEKVYDKQGNVVFEGKAWVSGDGRKLLVLYPDKIQILNLPEQTIINEYLGGGFLSNDGRFLMALSPSGNQLIIDTLNQVSSEIPVPNVIITRVESTKDGKYLLFAVEARRLLFYQIN